MRTRTISVGHLQAIELLRANCSLGSLVIDAGAWPGDFSRHLKHLGWDVIALDKQPGRPTTWQRKDLLSNAYLKPSADAGTTFQEEMVSIGVDVRAVDLETTEIPVETGTVDAVVLTEVIEHLWNDPLFALAEINRVLKEDSGVLILSTPNFLSLRNRWNFLCGRIHKVIENPFVSFLKKSRLGHFGHIRLYCPTELKACLELLGFEPEFHFRSLQYHQETSAPWGCSGATDSPASHHTTKKRSIFRKLIRSPRSYCDAAMSTMRTRMEAIYPILRSHMFVVATKIRDADFDKNRPSEVEALVLNNRL